MGPDQPIPLFPYCAYEPAHAYQRGVAPQVLARSPAHNVGYILNIRTGAGDQKFQGYFMGIGELRCLGL